jgi:hypothetical protein
MAKQPQLLGYTSLLGDPVPVPSKWDRVKQALWETNLNAPVRGIYNLMNTPYDVLMGGDSPEKQQAVADSFDAAGGITVGSMPMPKPSNSLSMGIKAYHGSPHSFDKFSMDKIGTGEGAQAYGHGLYFAENEGVAKGYRDALTDPEQVKIRVNDKHIPSVWVEDLRSTFPEMYKGLNEADQDVMDSLLGTMESAYSVQDAANAAESVGGRAKALFNQRVKPFVSKPEVGPGSMYEVNIDADPNAFLDWDKPLSEQPEAVKKVLRPKMGDSLEAQPGRDYLTGEQFYKYHYGDQPHVASSDLKKAGIPGIKYLDAGSRGAGDGTRNYVVFDDKLISIVRKYGIAGASAMLGYSVLDGATKAQAAELEKANAQYHGSNLGGGGW